MKHLVQKKNYTIKFEKGRFIYYIKQDSPESRLPNLSIIILNENTRHEIGNITDVN